MPTPPTINPQRVVIIDGPLPAQQRARLEALSPTLRLVDGLTPAHLREAEVVFLGDGKIDPAAAAKLRWVQFNSAGIGGLLGTALAASSIPVASASGAYSTTVAEMALALLLALIRKLPDCRALQERRVWTADVSPLCGQSCRGRTVGILGYGSIGREAARLLQALGMRVLACKRHPSERGENRFHLPGTGDPTGVIPEAWYGFDQVETMLRQTDVLLVTLPATSATRGLLQRRHLEALPRHALLISVGRGSVIEEAALADLLGQGRLAGAGLDVTAEEPLAATSPLWTLPHVVITPHIASYTVEQAALASEVFIENMRRDLAGEPLLNLVDFAAGY